MYYLFCLVVLAEENSRKPLLLVTYRNQVYLYFHFYLKNKKVSKIPVFFNMTWSIEMKYNAVFMYYTYTIICTTMISSIM